MNSDIYAVPLHPLLHFCGRGGLSWSGLRGVKFKKILKTYTDQDTGEEVYVCVKKKDAEGRDTAVDAEYYAFTGSKILIDQAINDFTKEDLPCPTVIQQFATSKGQTFFKFT